jgi:hypothetical protein
MEHLVIVVGGYYPNFGNPMGIVLEKLRASLERRYDISVIALKRSLFDTQLCFQYEGVTVHQATSRLNDLTLPVTQSRWLHIFKIGVVTLCAILRCEGRHAFWERMAYRKLDEIYRRKPFTRLLTLSFPIQLHRAGRRLKQKHPETIWYTYSTDSYFHHPYASRIPFKSLRKWIADRRAKDELKCYQYADFNFFSREIVENSKNYLYSVANKSSILDYTLFDSGLIKHTQQYFSDESKINLLFAGTFSLQIRSPDYFIEVLKHLPAHTRIVWHVYSLGIPLEMLQQAISQYPERFQLHQPVSPKEIESVMTQADVLVNLGNNSDLFSPSKLFDYLSTGRPIINVYYKGRKKNAVFDKHPMVLEIENYGDAKRDADRLEAFCASVKGKQLTVQDVATLYPEHVPEFALKRLFEAFECHS